mgnify:CR=1 FL=1
MTRLDFTKLASLWVNSHLTANKQYNTTDTGLTDITTVSCPDVFPASKLQSNLAPLGSCPILHRKAAPLLKS